MRKHGYEVKDALDLGEQAITLKNVSEAGATAESSANTLISTMKAFNMEATESEHVVNSLNKVSNEHAVSVNDLSTAIKKSSASLAAGNNTFEQTLGLVTAGKFRARLYRNIHYKRPLIAESFLELYSYNITMKYV